MPEKILYFLGAGASAQAMPLSRRNSEKNIPSLPDAMREIAKKLQEDSKIIVKNDRQQIFCSDIANDLNLLAKEGEAHTTVDTYMKHLYI